MLDCSAAVKIFTKSDSAGITTQPTLNKDPAAIARFQREHFLVGWAKAEKEAERGRAGRPADIPPAK